MNELDLQIKQNWNFEYPFKYHVIYIFQATDLSNKYIGCLKIGMSSVKKHPDGSLITKQELRESAEKRIKKYTTTIGCIPDILHVELAIANDGSSFTDYKVHEVLRRSGYQKVNLGNAKEWFKVPLGVAIKAIECVKEGKSCLDDKPVLECIPIKLRTEQIKAIEKAFNAFKLPARKCLWNCKMRFGKTISALELIKRSKDYSLNFSKILIATNRPSVSAEWKGDYDNFFLGLNLNFYSRSQGEKIEKYITNTENSIVFVSAQDLKGSQNAGGNYDKLDNVFNTSWDLIIIDEAHEGWKSERGEDVLTPLIHPISKNKPYVLYLSGTPFNIESDFTKEETYTWTYLDEQKAKIDWNANNANLGESNPYDACPKMEIYTINLDKITNGEFHNDNSEVYFNFAEFFRTDKVNNEFINKGTVKAFLNKLHSGNDSVQYPFTPQFRNYFHHTLWLVPGVAEAKALKKLLEEDETFQMFTIVDVTGSDIESVDALQRVKNAIGNKPNETWTITITCQRLTVGATIPEWTAILYLAGTTVTSKIKYLQSIFRVQSACNNYDGMVKNKCYVFDFAPERTLRMIASECLDENGTNLNISDIKKKLEDWLQFMPVISLTDTTMQPIKTNELFRSLQQVQGDRIYESGFQDPTLFDLSDMDKVSIAKIEAYNNIFKNDKILTKNKGDVVVNDQGINSSGKKSEPKPVSREEKQQQKQRKKWRELLQAIGARLPLLIYGSCDPSLKDTIEVNNLVKNVDEESWEQFMPAGFTKKNFQDDFAPYINPIKFNFAAHKLLDEVGQSNKLPIGLRIAKLANVINKFKNPDKETVLTPWRVVNMQLSSCFGGQSFYDDDNQLFVREETKEGFDGQSFYDDDNHLIYQFEQNSDDISAINPKVTKEVNLPEITDNVFELSNKFLDVNSKLGLYLLYMAYSLFAKAKQDQPIANDHDLWKTIIENNIFAICKSKMAQALTIRTLVGNDKGIHVNTYVPKDESVIWSNEHSNEIVQDILNPLTWGKEPNTVIKFDAIVGNPPYGQLNKMKINKGSNTKSIYPDFFTLATNLTSSYISLIMPARWMTCDKELDKFRNFVKSHNFFTSIYIFNNSKDVFSMVDIKGGICYFLWEKGYQNEDIKIYDCKLLDDGKLMSNCHKEKRQLVFGDKDGSAIIVNPYLLSIKSKVWKDSQQKSMEEYVSARNPYNLETNFVSIHPKYFSYNPAPNTYAVEALVNQKRANIYIYKDCPLIKDRDNLLHSWKIFIPNAYGCGAIGEVISTPVLSTPGTLCTDTFLQIGIKANLQKEECIRIIKYIQTKFFRCLVGIKKITQHCTREKYEYVPVQDFSTNSDIDWSKSIDEIDEQLFKKYQLSKEDIEFINTNITRQPLNFETIPASLKDELNLV